MNQIKRLRPIQRYGTSIILRFNTADILDFDLQVGDLVDISDLVITKEKEKKDGRNVRKKKK